MNAHSPRQLTPQALDPAMVAAACRVIAPNWPLDRQIAVNPLWGLVDLPFHQATQRLTDRMGGRFTWPAQAYDQAWRDGRITAAALLRALQQTDTHLAPEQMLHALRHDEAEATGLPLLSDSWDSRTPAGAAPRWRDTITQQVSQYCAAAFDDVQTDWHGGLAPDLYVGWRSALQVDHAIEPLMHAPLLRARAHDLPATADAALQWALQRLDIGASDAQPLLETCLLRINGWASWCAYLAWEARLHGGTDDNLQQLLAIRICWEALLDDGARDSNSVWHSWRDQWNASRQAQQAATKFPALSVWQRAQEISYQDELVLQLEQAQARKPVQQPWPSAQLVFCIDVRSERLRRHLEAISPTLQTLGFAGFFGLPIQYQPLASPTARPQLPGLLAPALTVRPSCGDAGEDARLTRQRTDALCGHHARQGFQRSPTGAFSLVECLGLGYAGALLRRHLGAWAPAQGASSIDSADQRGLRPQLQINAADPVTARAKLAATVLRAMSLSRGFARLLVLVGHGSQSANNPQAAALDCGACGGQTGEVNARTLATLLNEAAVRAALVREGILLPADTVAVAALHNTTTDEVTLLDLEDIPGSHVGDVQALQATLREAGERTRAERAADLGLAPLAAKPQALLKALRQRATDWAQTRPEWGLANNAAFIVAPRSRTRGLNLDGRCFLHDYDWHADTDNAVLELIMTAPMVVTHWINLQYYASTVAPARLGSGNKILHNVACSRIGVFEGNTGDLRIGLAIQSVHDGERWMHTPLRLSVFIEAPRDRIDAIIDRHEVVRHLVHNQWLYLLRLADEGIEWRTADGWQPWTRGLLPAALAPPLTGACPSAAPPAPAGAHRSDGHRPDRRTAVQPARCAPRWPAW